MTLQDRRRNFLRRTTSSTPPSETEYTTVYTTESTKKFTRRLNPAFSRRNPVRSRSTTESSRTEAESRRASSTSAPRPSEAAPATRPTRTFRRRAGGVNASTVAPTSSTSSAKSTITSRRPYRIASRRRALPTPSTTTTTSTTLPTTTISEEDQVTDSGSIEEQTLQPRQSHYQKKTVKVQRRPLTSLKVKDQNPAASTDEENKRQSKKYSSSFKQNQLDKVLRQKSKSQEEIDTTTEQQTSSLDDFSPDTAVALAAHQLLSAPLPSTNIYTDDSDQKTSTKKTTTKNYPTTSQKYEYSSPDYTDVSYDYSSVADNVSSQKTSTKPSSDYSNGYTISNLQYTSKPKGRSPVPGILSNSIGYSGVAVPVLGPSTVRYLGTTDKYVSIPIEDFGYSTDAYTGGLHQEPVYFTREYLLESPVTKTYDEEYQYLAPITTPLPTTRKRSRITSRRISTTIRPSLNLLPITTTHKPRRTPQKKPFTKISKVEPNRTYKPIENYDYYDDSQEKLVQKYAEGTKVVLHGKGTIECLDIGNFPHPTSCKKFISCARMESGAILGWEYICPKGLSFDPVGGICNWSAGLGCEDS